MGSPVPSETRQKHARAPRMFAERFSKLLRKKTFFLFGLEVKAQQGDRQGNEAALLPQGHNGSGKCDQHPGVNGMADKPIRPRADQLVTFLQRDGATPVFAQMPARPDGKCDTNHGESKTDFGGRIGGRKKACPEPTAPESIVEHQAISRGHEDNLYEAPAAAFALFHLLQLQRGKEPVSEENEPSESRP